MTRWYMFQWLFGPIARFLQRIGMGATVLRVEIEGDEHPRASTVTGTITVHAVMNDQHVDRLTVSASEYLTQSKSSTTRDLLTDVVASNLEIKVDVPAQFRFEIRVPDDIPISPKQSSSSIPSAARIIARAKNTRGKTKSESIASLHVVPHREILAIYKSLESLGFVEDAWHTHHLSNPNAGQQAGRSYKAPPQFSDHIDGVTVIAEMWARQVSGKLIINWTEKGLAERLKAAVGGNRLEIPILWERDELVIASGGPNIEIIAPRLESLLHEAFERRDGPGTRLLRPSESPNDNTAKLLRPANNAESARNEELLRPTTSPEI